MNITETLISAGYFFIVIAGELVLLFVGISFLVGLLHAYIPEERIRKTLTSKGEGAATVFGGIFGALTPFCSCSTIPILVSLINAKVPFPACMAFLLTSPLLNPVILILLAALIGPVPTAIYAIITFVIAVLLATILGKLGYESDLKEVMIEGMSTEKAYGSVEGSFKERHGPQIQAAFRFAISLFRQVLPYLILGAAIGAFIYGFIPEDLIISLAGPENPFAILVAAVIGIPMYIRAETIIPISAVLISKGMGIGAVMALIIGGAGASIPEVTLLSAIFKKRLVAAFVITVIGIAITAGVLFQVILS
ncbi:MAG: permease [Methanocalculus sp.]|uniref:permease n=1 Tax=Methanocalculus sp. TaxID=2004547 RepID=UPI00271EA71C|nr:permease [Methanocalculus sp.]MDO9540377.1 permease [Methanocalculus sp.]